MILSLQALEAYVLFLTDERRAWMDKILSARVDESVVNRIGSLARRLQTSEKKIIESAIERYATQVDKK